MAESARPAVLDASALAALILGEPGADAVARVMDGALVSAVNVAEVLIVLARRGADPDEAARLLESLPLEIVNVDAALAPRVAQMHMATRTKGLSLGDCACLATARAHNGVAYTADRNWQGLRVGVPVRTVR